MSESQKQEFAAFGKKFGNHAEPEEAKSYLTGTFGLFCGLHSEALARLKEFRGTIGAHSDSRATITSLPSDKELEALFGFANEFYRLISHSIHNVGPAPVPRKVGHGFIRLLKSVGVSTPKFDFDN